MSTPSKSRKNNAAVAGNQRIKAVVRKLPPNLPEELFWKSCELWVNDNTAKERWFVKGAMKGSSPEELATFSQTYDGHIFRDKQGNEFSAIVEFAPSQKLPLTNPKVDGRQGTIEDDEDYKSFLSLLEKGENPSKEKPTSQIIADPTKPESTPLLESLITSKRHASAASSGGKFSKHKPQHASTSKPRVKEDDAHFSRAQPIVPSGPVTLLTAAKSENASKAGATANPALSPSISVKSVIQAKETGVKNKAKGKGGGGESQESPSKAGKAKAATKRQAAAVADANVPDHNGEGGPSKPGTKKEDTGKKPPTPKKKKPAPAPQAGSSTPVESTDKPTEGPSAAPSGRGRGRGRGGGGRGGVLMVPKILTKIISEGAGPATVGKSGTVLPTTAPAALSGNTSATGEVAEGIPGSPPQSAPGSRGGDRGGRPFSRGRGRGRGRGAPRGGAPATEN